MFAVRATRDLRWIAERTGAAYSVNARAIEAIEEKSGRTVGMVGYDSFTHNSVQISIALDVPAAWRRLRHPAFEYPFQELKRGVLIALVSSANARSLNLTAHVGFRTTHKIRDAILPGVDLVLFEMRREDCPWLEAA